MKVPCDWLAVCAIGKQTPLPCSCDVWHLTDGAEILAVTLISSVTLGRLLNIQVLISSHVKCEKKKKQKIKPKTVLL